LDPALTNNLTHPSPRLNFISSYFAAYTRKKLTDAFRATGDDSDLASVVHKVSSHSEEAAIFFSKIN
jgi:hypothetical protein